MNDNFTLDASVCDNSCLRLEQRLQCLGKYIICLNLAVITMESLVRILGERLVESGECRIRI